MLIDEVWFASRLSKVCLIVMLEKKGPHSVKKKNHLFAV